MSRILPDIKWMPLFNQGFNYILLATCEVSNYMIGIPIQKANDVTIAEDLHVTIAEDLQYIQYLKH